MIVRNDPCRHERMERTRVIKGIGGKDRDLPQHSPYRTSSPHMRSLVRSSLMQVRAGLESDGETMPVPSGPDMAFGGGIEGAGGGEGLGPPPLTKI